MINFKALVSFYETNLLTIKNCWKCKLNRQVKPNYHIYTRNINTQSDVRQFCTHDTYYLCHQVTSIYIPGQFHQALNWWVGQDRLFQ